MVEGAELMFISMELLFWVFVAVLASYLLKCVGDYFEERAEFKRWEKQNIKDWEAHDSAYFRQHGRNSWDD
jgi:hypothetical protein